MNILNLFGAILTIIIGLGMAYGLYQPIMDMIALMPTGMQIFLQVAALITWVTIFTLIPYKMAIADDQPGQ